MKSIPKHTLDYIDSWLELRSKWEDYPGFVVAIAKDGKIIFNKAYGFADLDSQQSLTTDHIFKVASHSKTFTAVAVMQLQEKNKLRIDDLVIEYLPWLKNHTDKKWSEVTIRQLLSHGAGVVRDGKDSDYWQLYRDFPAAEDLKRAILESDLIIEPNTKLKYSNYGYSLLGEIIENVSGVSYAEFVKQNIIEPLDLKNTYPDQSRDIISMLAVGHSRPTLNKVRIPLPSTAAKSMAAATGFCSTAEDLLLFYTATLPGSGRLLTDASKKEMQKIHWKAEDNDESYGLGFQINTIDKRTVIGHSGGFPGYTSKTYIDPNDKISVCVLVNSGSMVGMIIKAIYKLLDEFGDKPPKEELLKYEGRFVDLWGVVDVIAHAGGVRAIYPNSWFPLDYVDRLTVVDDNTLKIDKSGSYDSLGEHIYYERISENKIKKIIVAGKTHLPSDDGDLRVTWK